MSAIDSKRQTIWIVDAHRDNGKRLVVHADEKLSAFMELEAAIRAGGCPMKSRRTVETVCCLVTCAHSIGFVALFTYSRFGLVR